MNGQKWSVDSPNISYNSWLRDTAIEYRKQLKKNSERLQVQLSVLDSLICQEGISTERFERVSLALIHAMTEIHLLVILTEEK